MAAITNANLAIISNGFSKVFQNTFAGIESDYTKIATVVKSTTAQNNYGWLGQMPNMREWIGDRVIKDFMAHDYSIKNKDWESTVGVKATDIEDDNLGIYTPLVAELATNAARHPDQLVFELLRNGSANLCYDGQNFFDADHPVYENHDGTGAVSTVSNFVAGSDPAWYLLDVSRSLKPLIFQERKAPKFTAMTKADDEKVFMSNEYRYGVDARHNVGFGFWQMAYCSQQPLNATTFDAALTAMKNLKADGGNKLGIKPSLLVVPPSLRATALELLKAERNANGSTNINRDAVVLLESPWVGD